MENYLFRYESLQLYVLDRETRRMIQNNQITLSDIIKKFEKEALGGKPFPKYKNIAFPMTNLKQKLRCEIVGFNADFKNKQFEFIFLMPDNLIDRIIASNDEKYFIISQLEAMYAIQGTTFTGKV